MRDKNKALLHSLFGLMQDHPDLASQIEAVLADAGLAAPSRPPSAAVSEVSSVGED